MSIYGTAAALLAAALLLCAPAHAQQNMCDSQNQRIECAVQCCGLKTCAPACEQDCVRACVNACKNPAQAQGYTSQLEAYQMRCGNRSLRRGQLNLPR